VVGDCAGVECDLGCGERLDLLATDGSAARILVALGSPCAGGAHFVGGYTGFAPGLPSVGGRFRVLLGLGWRLE
jgi:hypothetical protein